LEALLKPTVLERHVSPGVYMECARRMDLARKIPDVKVLVSEAS